MSLTLRPLGSSAAPAAVGGYAQALEVEGAKRLLFISGQIPETKSGDIPAGFDAQAALVWSHVRAQVEAAGMAMSNIVKITTFLSSREFAVPNRVARQAALGEHTPALTVVITSIFDERWLLEVEAIAAD